VLQGAVWCANADSTFFLGEIPEENKKLNWQNYITPPANSDLPLKYSRVPNLKSPSK
jgi:hypothetical protein